MKGDRSRQSVSDWELGYHAADQGRRLKFIQYLWIFLHLSSHLDLFYQVWEDVMVRQWGWRLITEDEIERAQTEYEDSVLEQTGHGSVDVESHGRSSFATPFLAPPRPDYDLVGRRHMLVDLKRALLGYPKPIIALEGIPGVGKTALAVELAHDKEIREHFCDGVLWAGLGPKPDLLAHLGNWAIALGIKSAAISDRTRIPDRQDLLKATIGLKHILLVVDDAWTAVAAQAFQLGGPNASLLLTTRQPGNAVELAGMGTRSVGELDENDSFDLLRSLAPAAVDEDKDAAYDLAAAVKGLPLSLTLMGRYLRAESRDGHPRRIRSALALLSVAEKRLKLELTQSPPDHFPALQPDVPLSIWAAVAVSDETLSEAGRRTLYALSRFPAKPNTFSEEAAIAIANESTRTLDELSDAGLLEAGGRDRYTLHQVIADYVRYNCRDEGVADRFVGYFNEYVECYQDRYRALDKERTNIDHALMVASEKARYDILRQSGYPFIRFLVSRGLYSAALVHIGRMIYAADACNDDPGRVEALLLQAELMIKVGEFKAAEDSLQEALALSKKYDDKVLICKALTHLVLMYGKLAQLDDALWYLKEALPLAEELDDRRRISALKQYWGAIIIRSGVYEEFDLAEKQLLEGFEIAYQIEDWKRCSDVLSTLASLENRRKNHRAAERYQKRALKVARKTEDYQTISTMLAQLGGVEIDLGKYSDALEHLREGLEVAKKTENSESIIRATRNLAELKKVTGDYAEAAKLYTQAQDIASSIVDYWLKIEILVDLGEVQLLRRELDQAHDLFSDALLEAQEQDAGEYVAEALFGLGRIQEARGAYSEARKLYKQSYEMFMTLGNPKADEVKSRMDALPATDFLE